MCGTYNLQFPALDFQLFNSLFSSLQCTLMHYVGEMKTLMSSSQLVAAQVGWLWGVDFCV